MLSPLTLQLVLQIILPLMFIAELFRKRYKSKRSWLLEVSALGLFFFFIFLTARWDMFSYYLRFLLLFLFWIAAFIAYKKIETVKDPSSTQSSALGRVFHGVLIVGLLWLNINVLRGFFYPVAAVDISHPLKGGIYYVGGGGNSRWINNHNAFPPQTYALDIVRLNTWGSRASGLSPKTLESYTIYGDTVYSPCTGEVAVAIDGLADQVPPSRGNLAGNHIVISCQGVDLLLAHLKKGSLGVQAGDSVNVGTILGKVGNSGNSSQPHLHIHAEKGGSATRILDGVGVPLKVGGRFLARNSLFTRD